MVGREKGLIVVFVEVRVDRGKMVFNLIEIDFGDGKSFIEVRFCVEEVPIM